MGAHGPKPKIQCDWINKVGRFRCLHRADYQTHTLGRGGVLVPWRLCEVHRALAMRDLEQICKGFGLPPTPWIKLRKPVLKVLRSV